MSDISRLLRPTIKASQQRRRFAEGGEVAAPEEDWRDREAREGLKYSLEKADAARTWGDTARDVVGFPARMFNSLSAQPNTPEADQAAMMPETFANPLVKNLVGGLAEAAYSGVTAPGDARSGKLPMRGADGNTSLEAIRRGFDLASVAGGASAAGTARNTANAAGADVRILGKRLGREPGAADATAAEAAAAETSGNVGRGVAGSPGGGEGVRAAQLQAERWAGPHQPIEGLPRGAQLVDGELLVPGPVARVHDVARDYMQGKDYPDYPRPEKYHPIDTDHARAIAQAFEDMPHAPNDPQVIAAYDAMIAETMAQYQAIKQSGLKLTPTGTHDYPYTGNPRAVARDVAENNHMAFFKTDEGFGSPTDLTGHPMLRPSGEKIGNHDLLYNDIFRIVHDYFGHIKHGYGFRAAGEDNAFRQHAAMYSPLARRAMTTETRGQNSWLNYGPHGEHNRTALATDTVYAPQKVGLMPEWTMHDRAPGGTTLASDSGKPGAAIAAAEHAKPFYSHLEQTVEALPVNKATGEQWLGTLNNKGVKPEEMDWTGLRSYLAENTGKPVTKAQVQEHLGANKLELGEVNKGAGDLEALARKLAEEENGPGSWDRIGGGGQEHYLRDARRSLGTKYDDYQFPGGENYREKLLTLPVRRNASGDIIGHEIGGDNYVSRHWDRPNVLVHRRTNDRTFDIPHTPEEQAANAARGSAQPQLDALRQQQDAAMREISSTVKPLEAARRSQIMADVKAGKMSGPDGMRALEEYYAHPEIKPLQDKLQQLRAAEDDIRAGLPAEVKPKTGRALHIEEIQSDWHQAGRKRGYAESGQDWTAERTQFAPGLFGFKVSDGRGNHIADVSAASPAEAIASAKRTHHREASVPDAPFKKNWHELALKDAIREAAEKGHDRISWTPGDAQAGRYDLSKQIESLKATPIMDQHGLKYEIRAKGHGGTTEPINTVATEAELPNIVGKEMAQKIVDQTEGKKPVNFTGLDLKVGGDGMRGFYDKMIPDALNRIGKPHGVKVQKGEAVADKAGWHITPPDQTTSGKWMVKSNDYNSKGKLFDTEAEAREVLNTIQKREPVHYMDIPQSLKDQALKKGFSLFEDSGAAAKPIAAAAHTNTPQFKQWFGDSQVVTKDGTPQTLYHGTPNHEHAAGTLGGFDTFDRLATSKIIKGRTPGMDSVGSWFSDLPTEKGAAMYSGGDNATHGSIYPVHLRVEHPWEPKDFTEFLSKMHEEAGSSLDAARKKGQPLGRVDPEPLREWLQSEGYDGIKFPKGTVDGKEQTVWVALEPNQVKSATGNSGAFSRSNSSILHEDSGAAGKPIAAAANVNAAEARVKAARGATRLTTKEGLAVPGKDYTKASREALGEIAAGRKGAGPLDLSSMNEIPNVPQTAMDRYVPPRGVSERMKDALADKGVVKGVAKSIEAGRAMGADKWYHNEPVRRAFVEELGPERGAKAFTTYMDMVSATSPRSDVPTNIRNGSFYYQHALEGKPLPGKLPYPYGHVAQKLHGSNYDMLTGPRASNLSAAAPEASTAWDIYKNPKPASFSQNLQGNLEPGTIDTHAFKNITMRTGDPRFLETSLSQKLDPKRAYGPDSLVRRYGEEGNGVTIFRPQQLLKEGRLTMDEAKKIPAFWAAKPKDNEYAAAEQLFRKLGAKAGMPTADAQAAAWSGAGKMTGLASPATHTFAELFNERVLYTSKMRGENPKKTLSDFITGKKPLLSLAGATAVGSMLAGGGDEKPGFAEGGAVGDDYNTQVPDEQSFQQWKATNAPNDSGIDYDLRGAYLANMQRAENGHMGDQFKKPNHPTFSDQSQYAVGDQRARMGYWVGDTFVPPVATRAKGGRVRRFAEGGDVDEAPAFDPAKLAAATPAPVFDPKKLAAAKAFDPNDPSTQPSTISEGLQRVWAKPTPGGPVWMAKEAYEGIRNSIDRAKLKGAVQSGAWSPSTEEEAGQLNQIDDRGAVDALRAVQFMSPSAPKGTGGIFAAPYGPRGAAKLVTPEATANRALADEFEIPLTRGQATQDLDQIRYEDMAARGAYGKDLQDRAAGVFDNQYGAIQSGTQRVGQTVARGEQPLGSPVNAGASLNTEVADTASRAAAARDLLTRRAEQAGADQRAQVAAQGRSLDETIGQPGRPLAEPRQAGELANQGVRDAATQDKAFYQAKYEDVGRRPGEFSTNAFEGVGSRIRNDLTFHADPVEITDLTPAARHAIEALDQWSVPSVKNAADPRAPFADTPTSITLKGVDTFMRRLSSFYKSTQPGTEDRRAMGRIMGEFGNQVEKAMADGLFSGDPEALAVLGEAKAAFSRYQRTYKPREAGDDVGTAMRRIVERNATPEETANMIVGSGRIGNAGLPVRIADRLQEVLGADSEAWGAIRQAMWQKASQVRSRTGEIDPVASARSIEDFVGSSLAARMFPQQRAAMRAHAQGVRDLDRVIESLPETAASNRAQTIYQEAFSGDHLSGSQRAVFRRMVEGTATPEETAQVMFAAIGGGNPGDAARALSAIQNIVGRDSPVMNTVRQGVWQRLTQEPFGKDQKGQQKMVQAVNEFLNGKGGSVARQLYSEEERKLMGRFADAVRLTIIPKYARTNSDTAPAMLAAVRKYAGAVGAAIGAVFHGGASGGAEGYAVTKAIDFVGSKIGKARQTRKLNDSLEDIIPKQQRRIAPVPPAVIRTLPTAPKALVGDSSNPYAP